MTDKTQSKLRSMMMKGKEYREEYEFEYFGETATVLLKPIEDEIFVEMIEDLDDILDESEMEDKLEQLEEGDEVPEEGELNSDFVGILKQAAKLGIDPEPFGEDQEFINEFVDSLYGGASLEIGSEVMDITSNLQDAKRFRRK